MPNFNLGHIYKNIRPAIWAVLAASGFKVKKGANKSYFFLFQLRQGIKIRGILRWFKNIINKKVKAILSFSLLLIIIIIIIGWVNNLILLIFFQLFTKCEISIKIRRFYAFHDIFSEDFLGLISILTLYTAWIAPKNENCHW